MALFTPPPDASPRVGKVLDVLGREVADAFTELSTAQQNEFWTALHGYSLAEVRGEGRRASLVAAPDIDYATRRALQVLDGQMQSRLEDLNAGEREEFWRAMHEFSERQEEQTKQASGHVRRHSST